MDYAQLAISPAGSGKSTHCPSLYQHSETTRRSINFVNLDPAAEKFDHPVAKDIKELISLEEGMSSFRPPLFDGINYNYWSSRMKIHVQTIDFTLWRIIANGPLIPKKLKGVEEVDIEDIYTIDFSELRESEKIKISQNAKAINILYQSLCIEEYERIQGCESAKEIWDCLEAIHVGTNQVKDTKIRILTSEYESFKRKEGESILEMHQRLNVIINNLKGLGKKYSRKDINIKILASLTKEYRPKTCAINEVKDIEALQEEDLIGSLLAFELELNSYKAQDLENNKEKKNLALHVSRGFKKPLFEDDSDDELSDEEIIEFTKKFKKYYKRMNIEKGEEN